MAPRRLAADLHPIARRLGHGLQRGYLRRRRRRRRLHRPALAEQPVLAFAVAVKRQQVQLVDPQRRQRLKRPPQILLR